MGGQTAPAQASPVGSGTAPQPQVAGAPAQGQPQAPVAAAAPQRVDIEQVLNEMAARNPQKLNWRTSIVDLMKLVGMESSLAERLDEALA